MSLTIQSVCISWRLLHDSLDRATGLTHVVLIIRYLKKGKFAERIGAGAPVYLVRTSESEQSVFSDVCPALIELLSCLPICRQQFWSILQQRS